MLFPFRLLVLHSSVWFFSFFSSVSCWSLILSLYQIPIGMLCSFFFPLSFNAIIKNCYCEMNFHMDVVLPWNVHFILYIWFNSSNMTSETKTTAHERDLKWMEKKMLQMMWIWFVVCFGSHCKNIFLSLRLWALGGFLAFSLQANTHNIFWYETESNIINVVWNFWIYTPNARDFHHSVSVCMCIFLSLFLFTCSYFIFFSFTKSTVHGNVRNVLACDNGLCESNMINL